MAELIPPNEEIGRPGHLPNVPGTLVELHRLVSIFLASEGFARLIGAAARNSAELHDPMFQLQQVDGFYPFRDSSVVLARRRFSTLSSSRLIFSDKPVPCGRGAHRSN
jgi:hypothetical protein